MLITTLLNFTMTTKTVFWIGVEYIYFKSKVKFYVFVTIRFLNCTAILEIQRSRIENMPWNVCALRTNRFTITAVL